MAGSGPQKSRILATPDTPVRHRFEWSWSRLCRAAFVAMMQTTGAQTSGDRATTLADGSTRSSTRVPSRRRRSAHGAAFLSSRILRGCVRSATVKWSRQCEFAWGVAVLQPIREDGVASPLARCPSEQAQGRCPHAHRTEVDDRTSETIGGTLRGNPAHIRRHQQEALGQSPANVFEIASNARQMADLTLLTLSWGNGG